MNFRIFECSVNLYPGISVMTDDLIRDLMITIDLVVNEVGLELLLEEINFVNMITFMYILHFVNQNFRSILT